jgi:hypothetical protein
MLKSKNATKELSICFVPNAKAGCMQLMIGWPAPQTNWFVLNKLKRGEPCGCVSLAYGSEETALNYSLFQHIRNKLNNDPNSQRSSKVSQVNCDFQNNMFYLFMQTVSNTAGVRKVLTMIIQSLTPTKLYKSYCANIKVLNGKPSRAQFNHCANQMSISVKTLSCIISGKMKLDNNKLNDLVDYVVKKYKNYDKLLPEEKPCSLTATPGKSEYPRIKAEGVAAPLTIGFLNTIYPDVMVINSPDIIVYNNKWEPPSAINDKIDKWCASRYGKIIDLTPVLVYFITSIGTVDPVTLSTFAATETDSKSVATMIKKVLK